MLQDMDEISRKTSKSVQILHRREAWNRCAGIQAGIRAPGLTFNKFLQTLQGLTDKNTAAAARTARFTYRTLMVAGMHFMDSYNYDIERVKRCVIHYAAPNGLLYPFCTYNSGPVFRDKIERQYSVPLEELRRKGQVKRQRMLDLKAGCGSCGVENA